MFVSLRHKEQFDREGISIWIFVEEWKEWILVKLFQYQFARILRFEQMREGSFTCPNIAFNGNILIWNFRIIHLQTTTNLNRLLLFLLNKIWFSCKQDEDSHLLFLRAGKVQNFSQRYEDEAMSIFWC